MGYIYKITSPSNNVYIGQNTSYFIFYLCLLYYGNHATNISNFDMDKGYNLIMLISF